MGLLSWSSYMSCLELVGSFQLVVFGEFVDLVRFVVLVQLVVFVRN